MCSIAPWFAMQCSTFEHILPVTTDSEPSDTRMQHAIDHRLP